MNKCVMPTVRPSHVSNDPIAKGHMAGSLRGKPGRVAILQTWRVCVRMPHLLTPEESDWRSSRRAAVGQTNGRSSDSFVFRCLPVLLPNAAGDSKPTLAAFGHSGFASGAKIGTIKKRTHSSGNCCRLARHSLLASTASPIKRSGRRANHSTAKIQKTVGPTKKTVGSTEKTVGSKEQRIEPTLCPACPIVFKKSASPLS